MEGNKGFKGLNPIPWLIDVLETHKNPQSFFSRSVPEFSQTLIRMLGSVLICTIVVLVVHGIGRLVAFGGNDGSNFLVLVFVYFGLAWALFFLGGATLRLGFLKLLGDSGVSWANMAHVTWNAGAPLLFISFAARLINMWFAGAPGIRGVITSVFFLLCWVLEARAAIIGFKTIYSHNNGKAMLVWLIPGICGFLVVSATLALIPFLP